MGDVADKRLQERLKLTKALMERDGVTLDIDHEAPPYEPQRPEKPSDSEKPPS